jgi:hypothetical protein
MVFRMRLESSDARDVAGPRMIMQQSVRICRSFPTWILTGIATAVFWKIPSGIETGRCSAAIVGHTDRSIAQALNDTYGHIRR